MKVVISSGHGLKVRGASGYLDEVNEARKVVEKVAEYFRQIGEGVQTFHDDTSTSQNQNLQTIVNFHNRQTRDYDVSVHFNAYQTTSKAMGTETLFVSSTGQTMANKVSPAIARAGTFINRGAKKRTDLYFLNNTAKPAILIEVCFVDSSTDANLYRTNFDAICRAITESITGRTISPPTEPPIEPPVEPPVTEPPTEPPIFTGDNRVEIDAEVYGDSVVYINGELISGDEECSHISKFNVKIVGDAVLVINGEEFHNQQQAPTGPKENHKDIEATVFGGASDPNNSAYPPFDQLNDTELYVALPYSWPNSMFPANAPLVRVFNGELSAVGKVRDKGPWTVDDEAYVMGESRPIAEICFIEKKPLPSGPNKGRVPSNKAGIDLSPAMARTIGVQGKGIVDWMFEDETVVA